MDHPELLIIGLNMLVILIAYFIIYPKYCGSDGLKISSNDLAATALVLTIAGSIFWGTGEQFNLILFSANWFWFTLITYALMEIPIMLWYFKKHNVWSSFKL